MPLQALISQKQHGGTFFFIIEFWSAGQHATFGKVKNIYYIHSASECKIYALERFRRYSSEIVLQPILFVVDFEFDDEEIKRGVPDPPKLEEVLDSQEESTEVDNEEQENKNLSPDEADSDMEGKLVDSNEEQSSTKPCGFQCTIWEKDYMM